MGIDNSTFFQSYNHLYHFHKANLIYYNYHNPSVYMDSALQELYGDNLKLIYLGDEEEFYKRTLLLDLRSTYLHCIETLFSFIAVLDKYSEPLLKNPKSINVFDELTMYDQQMLYTKIESYKASKNNLDFIDNTISDSDWSVGRFIFYAALRPPDEIYEEYLKSVNGSVSSIKTALQLLAHDFGDRKEYNSYKHSLRVLDAFRSMYLLDPVSKQMIKMDLTESLTYPVWNKKSRMMRLQTNQYDFERDHKMTLLAASLIRSIITNRRIAYNKKTSGPKQVPLVMWTEEAIAWHSAQRPKGNVKPLTLEEFERQHGFKVQLRHPPEHPI